MDDFNDAARNLGNLVDAIPANIELDKIAIVIGVHPCEFVNVGAVGFLPAPVAAAGNFNHRPAPF